MKNLLRAISQAIDLLDLVLFAAFTLITTGSYVLWGSGWACLVLGCLLLGLVLVGVPTQGKASR